MRNRYRSRINQWSKDGCTAWGCAGTRFFPRRGNWGLSDNAIKVDTRHRRILCRRLSISVEINPVARTAIHVVCRLWRGWLDVVADCRLLLMQQQFLINRHNKKSWHKYRLGSSKIHKTKKYLTFSRETLRKHKIIRNTKKNNLNKYRFIFYFHKFIYKY